LFLIAIDIMDINNQATSTLENFLRSHKEDIKTITQVLVRITNRTPEQVKPYLDVLLEQLVPSQQERPFYETATPEEWVVAFRAWADTHERNTPLLSDYAVSRESLYDEEEC
jgi:hypothetical protein